MTDKSEMYRQNWLPDLETHLENIDHDNPISIEQVDWIAEEVAAKTTLSLEQAKIVVRLFFQEMRNALLRGDKIYLEKLGNMFVSSPATTGTKRKVFVKFKPARSLVGKINGK